MTCHLMTCLLFVILVSVSAATSGPPQKPIVSTAASIESVSMDLLEPLRLLDPARQHSPINNEECFYVIQKMALCPLNNQVVTHRLNCHASDIAGESQFAAMYMLLRKFGGGPAWQAWFESKSTNKLDQTLGLVSYYILQLARDVSATVTVRDRARVVARQKWLALTAFQKAGLKPSSNQIAILSLNVKLPKEEILKKVKSEVLSILHKITRKVPFEAVSKINDVVPVDTIIVCVGKLGACTDPRPIQDLPYVYFGSKELKVSGMTDFKLSVVVNGAIIGRVNVTADRFKNVRNREQLPIFDDNNVEIGMLSVSFLRDGNVPREIEPSLRKFYSAAPVVKPQKLNVLQQVKALLPTKDKILNNDLQQDLGVEMTSTELRAILLSVFNSTTQYFFDCRKVAFVIKSLSVRSAVEVSARRSLSALRSKIVGLLFSAMETAAKAAPVIGPVAGPITLALGQMIQNHIADKNNAAERESVASASLVDMLAAFVSIPKREHFEKAPGQVKDYENGKVCDKQVKLLLQFIYGSLEDVAVAPTGGAYTKDVLRTESRLGQRLRMCMPETPDDLVAMQSLLGFLGMFVSGMEGLDPNLNGKGTYMTKTGGDLEGAVSKAISTGLDAGRNAIKGPVGKALNNPVADIAAEHLAQKGGQMVGDQVSGQLHKFRTSRGALMHKLSALAAVESELNH